MSIKDRISRWEELYASDRDVKVIRYIINYPDPNNIFPILSAPNKQKRIDWAKRLYEWQIKNVESYEDDSLPFLFPVTGTEIFAEAFGCNVIYPENNMPFALPLVSDSSAATKLKVPKLEDTPLMMLFDIADELRHFAGSDALIRLPDVQCPIDVSALIWDKNDFFLTMIDKPEAIHELAGKIKELQIAFFDEWFKRYGTTFIAHFPNYYMDGGITMSVDELGCVSPQMFREFFTGEINDLSQRYGGVGIHTCADSIRQWDNLKQIDGLKLLNIHYDKSDIFTAFDLFKDKCAQMHCILDMKTTVHNMTPDEVENRLPQFCKVVIPLEARDLDHAKNLAEKYRMLSASR
ncbi:MAG: hypothetical protein LBD23_17985 [Oscillospiraceae bacterium]|nr:hypothetical protein [Oscillospiraceae bacterium]